MEDFPYSDRSDAVFVIDDGRPGVFVRDSDEGFVWNGERWAPVFAGEFGMSPLIDRDGFLEYLEAATSN